MIKRSKSYVYTNMQNSGLATRLAVHLYPTVRSIYRLFVSVDLLNGVSAGDLHIRIVFSTAPVRTDPTLTRKEKIDTSPDLASGKPRSRSTPAAACLHRRAHPRPDSSQVHPSHDPLLGWRACVPTCFLHARGPPRVSLVCRYRLEPRGAGRRGLPPDKSRSYDSDLGACDLRVLVLFPP
jgi:hypothetical protein